MTEQGEREDVGAAGSKSISLHMKKRGAIKVEVSVVKKNDFSMQLIIEGVDVPLMNALRRIIMAEVPSMAIDEVVVIENSSLLHDEILTHRLGLIPLKTDLDSYNLPEECSCHSEFGCNLCRASLTLDVEATDGVKTVYSGDLIPENPEIRPVSYGIPIVKLAPGQKIRLEAYARLGKGINHAKWQPVSLCVYKYLPRIRIDESRCNACGKCVKICPKRVLVKVGSKIENRNLMDCTLCQDCANACPPDRQAIEIAPDEDAFIFNVESMGTLPIERILLEGFNVVDKKINDFLNQVAEETKGD
jgi:DNA-directed RNA polymerase subunit D